MVRRGSTVRVRQRAFRFLLLRRCFRCLDRRRWAAQRPSDVQGLDVGGFDVRVAVEEPDCVLASVAGEVAVVAVDHGPAGSQGAGGGGGWDAGTGREGWGRVGGVVEAGPRAAGPGGLW